MKFGSKGRNTRNDGYPFDRELPAVRALGLSINLRRTIVLLCYDNHYSHMPIMKGKGGQTIVTDLTIFDFSISLSEVPFTEPHGIVELIYI